MRRCAKNLQEQRQARIEIRNTHGLQLVGSIDDSIEFSRFYFDGFTGSSIDSSCRRMDRLGGS